MTCLQRRLAKLIRQADQYASPRSEMHGFGGWGQQVQPKRRNIGRAMKRATMSPISSNRISIASIMMSPIACRQGRARNVVADCGETSEPSRRGRDELQDADRMVDEVFPGGPAGVSKSDDWVAKTA